MKVPHVTNRSYHLLRTGIVGAAVLILALCAGAARFAWQYMQATAWVDHTTQVIGEIRETRMLLPGTVVLSGQALQAKLDSIEGQFNRVLALTQDNPQQQDTAKQFRDLIRSLADPQHRADLNVVATSNVLL